MYEYSIPEPLVFNPLKHYLPFIKRFIDIKTSCDSGQDSKELIKELKHLGTSVMDVYTGSMSLKEIFNEANDILAAKNLISKEMFARWAGTDFKSFKIVPFSDSSFWTMKYHENDKRYVHIFPSRSSPFTFRIKANTLKSAILYLIIIGKDYVTEDDLNHARVLTGLSPVKDVTETEAVTEMIDILRS
jgi:hypothetical protein